MTMPSTRWFEEALPEDAEYEGKIGPNEVWSTERWRYLIEPGTRRVLNISRVEYS